MERTTESAIGSPTRLTIDVKEVAELIGVSATCVYTLVREKQIPFKKIRSRILFHRPTIEA
ncbi:Helix-turn-helix domain protein [compost metagenome]